MTTEPRLETLLDVPVPLSRGRERRVSLQLPPLHDATSSRITLRPLALGNIPLIVTSGQVSQSTPTPFVEKESRIVKDVSNDDDGGKNIASLHGVDQEKNGPTPGSRDLGGQNPVGDEHYSKGGRSLKAKTRWTSSKRRKVNETGFRNRPLAPLVKIHEIGAGGSKLGPLNEQKISPARTSSVLPIAALSCDAANPAVPEPLSKNGEKISQDQTSSASPGSEHVASARQRRKWTPQETQALLQGVAEHGVGNWKKILADPKYSFNDRSGIDLKDRCVYS
ncbi:MAG: hypothetical protein M1823_004973 [Watsoniomyces obsoletus]|nr:MAG: hypothetical protein M1823_004973 [Watsoniomyces obsoletus]